ncbi:hypothetical protein PUNSTDRAFT_133519 [Punctularia strigosozonata HHB-11173 SS5]|uniref:uncharacterized protein n=1 Tax=Punctularia strigosozonata (strain HHB-11173) TaxID=741275 RepID=UPI0004416435|nr:uncharacterized protein PUNSTDRAFT_133519 [Punctularia strigosozonata HHB-11173 SS5]EIN09751.1 hypothetical protein PUNSTDRAFT_133519 [Punctularia strigosozonata HHB-11173 SS5]
MAAAIRGGARVDPKVAVDAHEGVSYVLHLARKDRDYVLGTSQDPVNTYDAPEFE